MNGHLYFHAPCFDGIVSAVLLNDFLEAKKGWTTTHLHAVNYDLKTKWLQTPLEPLAAIVDFLYHPGAQYWVDHHSTTFLTDAVQTEYEGRRGPTHVYEPTAPSCAGLLWRHLWEAFSHRNRQFEELSFWADKTDSANYESVDEAIFGEAPALRISKALGDRSDDSFCVSLVQQLRRIPLPEAAELPEVRLRFERTLAATRAGLTRLRQAVHLDESGIAVFDVDSGGVTINRYAPFLLGACFQFGWATKSLMLGFHPWVEFWADVSAVVLFMGTAVAIIVLIRLRGRLAPGDVRRLDRWWLLCVAILALAGGCLSDGMKLAESRTTLLVFCAAAVLLFCAWLCRRAHLEFARYFSRTVYESFLLVEDK